MPAAFLSIGNGQNADCFGEAKIVNVCGSVRVSTRTGIKELFEARNHESCVEVVRHKRYIMMIAPQSNALALFQCLRDQAVEKLVMIWTPAKLAEIEDDRLSLWWL